MRHLCNQLPWVVLAPSHGLWAVGSIVTWLSPFSPEHKCCQGPEFVLALGPVFVFPILWKWKVIHLQANSTNSPVSPFQNLAHKSELDLFFLQLLRFWFHMFELWGKLVWAIAITTALFFSLLILTFGWIDTSYRGSLTNGGKFINNL